MCVLQKLEVFFPEKTTAIVVFSLLDLTVEVRAPVSPNRSQNSAAQTRRRKVKSNRTVHLTLRSQPEATSSNRSEVKSSHTSPEKCRRQVCATLEAYDT